MVGNTDISSSKAVLSGLPVMTRFTLGMSTDDLTAIEGGVRPTRIKAGT
jgi:hypothetical protein